MERRDLLKTLATGVAGIGAGMTLFDESTGTASAAVSIGSFTISDGEQTTQDGQISDVIIDCSGRWEYDIPAKKEPDQWQVVLQLTKNDETAVIGADQGAAKYLTNNGNFALSGSVLETPLYAATDFEEDANGATNTVELATTLWFQVFSPDEQEIARAELSDSATVSVTNKEYDATEHGSVGGTGEVTIQA